MFRFMFGKNRLRKPTLVCKQNSRFRPGVEALEDRLLMSFAPLTPGPIADPVKGAPLATANLIKPADPVKAVDLVTVPRQVLSGHLDGASDYHLYSFQLQKGDFVEALVQTNSSLHLASLMSVLDSHGNTLATVGQSPDPAISP